MDNLPSQISNLAQFVDNRLAMDQHKINLMNIYNRSYKETSKSMSKSNEFYLRVQNNKKFARRNNREEEQYYTEKVNCILGKKLGEIHSRPNASIKINPYSVTAKNLKANIAKCQYLNQERIQNENIVFGIRLKSRPPFISTNKLEKSYLKMKEGKERQKYINIPNLQKLSQRLINQSPIHQKMIEYKRRKFNNKFYNLSAFLPAMTQIPNRLKTSATEINISFNRNLTKESDFSNVIALINCFLDKLSLQYKGVTVKVEL